MIRAFFLGVALALSAASTVAAAGARELVTEGNQAYLEKRYEEAIEAYEQAAEADPDEPAAQFNRGAALYRAERFGDAAAAFQQSAELARANGDSKLEARSRYSVGNAFLLDSDQLVEARPDIALDALRKSVASYKDALRLDPEFTDAGYNLELARARMRRALERLEQSPPQQRPGQGEDNLSDQVREALDRQRELNQEREQAEQSEDTSERESKAQELAQRQEKLGRQSEELARQAGADDQPERQMAQQDLEQAAREQGQAEEQLSQNDLEGAEEAQAQALKSLAEALENLGGKSDPNQAPPPQTAASSTPPTDSQGGQQLQSLRLTPEDILDQERLARRQRQVLLQAGKAPVVEKDW